MFYQPFLSRSEEKNVKQNGSVLMFLPNVNTLSRLEFYVFKYKVYPVKFKTRMPKNDIKWQ